MDTLGITPDERRFITGLIHLVRPDASIYAYGSRANGTARRISDLDILVRADKALEWGDVTDMRELFKASRLPYSVDVVDWHALSSAFRDIIKDDLVEL